MTTSASRCPYGGAVCGSGGAAVSTVGRLVGKGGPAERTLRLDVMSSRVFCSEALPCGALHPLAFGLHRSRRAWT